MKIIISTNKTLKQKTILQRKANNEMREAFTLLELLLVIAIIAVLAGIIMFTLNPADKLNSANNVKAVANAKDFEKALKAYTLDNEGNVPTGFSTITQSGIYDICKYGETTGCINLDNLITSGYIGNIPIDTRNATAYTTGYKVDYDASSKNIKIYTNEDYGRKISYCPPGDNCIGPIGEWLFNEGTGSNAYDTSGNNKNGSLIGTPSWQDPSNCKNQKCILLNGTNYISIGDIGIGTNGPATISGWFKFSEVQNGYYLHNLLYLHSINNLYYLPIAAQLWWTSPQIDQWYHIALSYNGVGNTAILYINGIKQAQGQSTTTDMPTLNSFKIGSNSSGSNRMKGYIDDLKVFNYVRTEAQIAWEYNQGNPIAHWKFDDSTVGSGQIKLDSSGNSLNGTTYSANGTGMDCTVSGKYGKGCSLDGIDDYVKILDNSLLDLSNNFSMTAWVYLRNQNSAGIVHKGNSTIKGAALSYGWDGNGIMFISWNGSNTPYLNRNSSDINQWHHLAGVVNNNIRYLYIDGLLINTSNSGISSWDSINDLILGCSGIPSNCVNAILDDVRIYNYPLNQSQVMRAIQEL